MQVGLKHIMITLAICVFEEVPVLCRSDGRQSAVYVLLISDTLGLLSRPKETRLRKCALSLCGFTILFHLSAFSFFPSISASATASLFFISSLAFPSLNISIPLSVFASLPTPHSLSLSLHIGLSVPVPWASCQLNRQDVLWHGCEGFGRLLLGTSVSLQGCCPLHFLLAHYYSSSFLCPHQHRH